MAIGNKEKTLWEQFNLRDYSLDQGGGILYCIRYSPERISAHRNAIIKNLESRGVYIEEVEDRLGVGFRRTQNHEERNSAIIMLEELSVLNEATEYQEAGLEQYRSIRELVDGIKTSVLEGVSQKNLVDIYNFLEMSIPQIVRDIRIADRQNKVLSNKERQALDNLMEFASRQVRQLNSPHGLVLLSLK
jgi:hypothetical protein